ncbi:MAG: cyclic pyranopterin monophosphate synthase MoaC [Deltaproteobacteria bacterium]|nr:cyclic pyranopterin monophosphate synthase MoaC [Deltaproteobacteria bacterium]
MGIDNGGMIDVGEKNITTRTATASCKVITGVDILDKIIDGTLPKGDLSGYARAAGILGAKKTPELIPLCHTLSVEQIRVDLEYDRQNGCVNVFCEVKSSGKTGVEMEALTGCLISGLTIYDMCKSFSKEIEITDAVLLRKTGGKSGDWEKFQ